MITSRRNFLRLGGGLIAAHSLVSEPSLGAGTARIGIRGRSDGSHVWFDPIGLRLEPGREVAWTNFDRGNSHTSTAYHPANSRPLRIPDDALPWDSDYLLPGETFSVMLLQPGVYDYYCRPHELAGMVGRIIVGEPQAGWIDKRAGLADDQALPEPAMNAFPAVERIMRTGIVRHE